MSWGGEGGWGVVRKGVTQPFKDWLSWGLDIPGKAKRLTEEMEGHGDMFGVWLKLWCFWVCIRCQAWF